MFRTDGSTTEDITGGFTTLEHITTDGQKVYFSGSDASADGNDLWVFDPSDSSVTQLTTIGSVEDEMFLVEDGCNSDHCDVIDFVGTYVIFNAHKLGDDGAPVSSGASLYAYDTSDSSLERLTTTVVQGHDDVRDMNVIGSVAYFTAEYDIGLGQKARGLFKTDGTFSGTSMVSSAPDGEWSNSNEHPQKMFEIDGTILTWAFVSDNGRELVHDQSVITTVTYSY